MALMAAAECSAGSPTQTGSSKVIVGSPTEPMTTFCVKVAVQLIPAAVTMSFTV